MLLYKFNFWRAPYDKRVDDAMRPWIMYGQFLTKILQRTNMFMKGLPIPTYMSKSRQVFFFIVVISMTLAYFNLWRSHKNWNCKTWVYECIEKETQNTLPCYRFSNNLSLLQLYLKFHKLIHIVARMVSICLHWTELWEIKPSLTPLSYFLHLFGSIISMLS